jgi:hypothetical protein
MKFDGLPAGGFHQRLAVGKMATSHDASTLMFSRDNKGQLGPGVELMLMKLSNSRTNR